MAVIIVPSRKRETKKRSKRKTREEKGEVEVIYLKPRHDSSLGIALLGR